MTNPITRKEAEELIDRAVERIGETLQSHTEKDDLHHTHFRERFCLLEKQIFGNGKNDPMGLRVDRLEQSKAASDKRSDRARSWAYGAFGTALAKWVYDLFSKAH